MLVRVSVANAELVIGVRPTGERWAVENDERGGRTLVERLRREAPDLIVLEATRGTNCSASPRSPPPLSRSSW